MNNLSIRYQGKQQSSKCYLCSIQSYTIPSLICKYFIHNILCVYKSKGKSRNDAYIAKCLLERTLVLGRRLYEVGWPFPSLTSLSPQCFQQAPICCWMNSERASNPCLKVCFEPRVFGTVGNAPAAMLPAHYLVYINVMLSILVRSSKTPFPFQGSQGVKSVFDGLNEELEIIMANTGLFIYIKIAVFEKSFFETKVQYEATIPLLKRMKQNWV